MPVNCEVLVAGTADPITLVLPSRRDLYVEVGASGGEEDRIWHVTLTRIDGTSEEVERFWLGLEHRRAHFFGLDPKGTYRLWGVDDFGPRYVLADAGPGIDRLDVKPQKGGEIRGRVLLPRHFMFAFIEVRDRGVEIEGSVEGDGSFVLRGVPPGRWSVWAHRRGPRGEIEDKKPGAVGKSVELDLRAR